MPSNPSENTYDRSVDIVRHAIPRMSELKIPITPHNYAVWYEYLAESNQPLRQEMDVLLQREQPITERELHELYERYLEERSEKVLVAKNALSQVVAALMQHVDQADGHYSDFSAELDEIVRDLADEASTVELNALIDRALRATNTALERGINMRKKFSDLAVEMQQVRSELAKSQVEARVDPLTGVFNRLAFREELLALPDAIGQDTHAPCLLLIDIDLFKQVNDSYGHLAGDHVLQEVAGEIKASVRGRDRVARYGGEEFAVLLRDTPRSGCRAVAENVRETIERCVIDLPRDLGFEQPLSVTVSVGGAWLRQHEATEVFVDRADRALYDAKAGGRNRVGWEDRPNDA